MTTRPMPRHATRYLNAQAEASSPSRRERWYIFPFVFGAALLLLAVYWLFYECADLLDRLDWTGFDRVASFAVKCIVLLFALYFCYILIAAYNAGSFDWLVAR